MKVKIIGVILLLMAIVLAIKPSPVLADGSVEWDGNGSGNLPCAHGCHWVATGVNDATSVTLILNGKSNPMSQHSNGSWSVDTTDYIDNPVTASISWVGDASKPSLQLSHCLDDPSTPTPSQTLTETPSNTPTPSATWTPTATGTVITNTPGNTFTPTGTETKKSSPPKTGGESGPTNFWFVPVIVLLLAAILLVGMPSLKKI